MKYTVLSNLQHDGQLYTQGDQVELSKEIGHPLEKQGVLSSAKVAILKQKDWKKGPEDIKHDPEDELKATGEIGKVNEEDGEDQQDEAQNESNESTEESTIAGAQDDTNKIDENIDANL